MIDYEEIKNSREKHIVSYSDLAELKGFRKDEQQKWLPIWLEKISKQIEELQEIRKLTSEALQQLAEHKLYEKYMIDDDSKGAIHKVPLFKIDAKLDISRKIKSEIIKMNEVYC